MGFFLFFLLRETKKKHKLEILKFANWAVQERNSTLLHISAMLVLYTCGIIMINILHQSVSVR